MTSTDAGYRAGRAYRRQVACDAGIVWTVRAAAAAVASVWVVFAVTVPGPFVVLAAAASSVVVLAALLVVVPLAVLSSRSLQLVCALPSVG